MAKLTGKIATIIRHEFLSKVKTKGFILSTLFGPIILLLFIAIPILVAVMTEDDSQRKMAVKDLSGQIGEQFVRKDTARYYLTGAKESELSAQVMNKEIDGYIIIPDDVIQTGNVRVYSSGGGGIGFIHSMERDLAGILRHERLLSAGADTSVINLVEKGVNVQTNKVTKEGIEKDYAQTLAWLGYMLGFLVYGMMFMYGGLVMRGVIEEKTNRIVEVIASSARPFEIMFGKVVGIGAVGLTQVLIWLIFAALALTVAEPVASMFMDSPQEAVEGMQAMQQGGQMPAEFEIPDISPWIGVAFLFYFLAGYFIYATMFAGVGSAVDQEQDAAQLQLPVTMPIIFSIFFIFPVMSNPDGTLAVVISLIPFFTPILMVVRIAATSVPFWQIALSIALMILTFFGALWAAGKIYRVGILMTGKKPNIKDLIKWMRA